MKYWHLLLSLSKGVRTRPTRYFVLLVILMTVLFLQAFMHNYNIVYLTLFFLTAYAGSAELIGRLNLHHLEVSLLPLPRAFSGQPLLAGIQLQNRGRTPVYALQIHSHLIPRVEANGTALVTLPFTPQERGVWHPPKLQVQSRFPLPHLQFFIEREFPANITVYPEPKGCSLDSLHRDHQAPYGTVADFDGLKSFESGDSLSKIHWPSVAKNTGWMSKRFVLENPTGELELDFEKIDGSVEERLSQLCLWILECESRKTPFCLKLPHQILESEKGGIDAILETLARY